MTEKNESIDLQKYKQFQTVSAFILFGLRSLWHDLLKTLGNYYYFAAFCPINDSVWEHGKIVLNPLIVWSLVEYFYQKPSDFSYFVSVKCYTMFYAILLEYSYYYTYTGIIGHGFLIVDILDVLVCMIYACYLSCECYSVKITSFQSKMCIMCVIILQIMFITFTFYQPHIPFFWCTITKRYGADLKY